MGLLQGLRPTVLVAGVALLALVLALPLYLSTRDLSMPPSSFERVFAIGWVWFRRIVCLSSSLLCMLFAFGPFIFAPRAQASWQLLWWVLGWCAGAAFTAFLGVFGQGSWYYVGFGEARRIHLQHKQRYGLCF
jgi:hypothetical protein